MIAVKTDKERKLVDVTLSGFVKLDEAVRVSNELKKTMMQFGPKEAALMIDLVGFAPMSNDVLPVIRGMGRDVITFFRKTALVQEYGFSYGGGRKIIEPPPGYTVKSFQTRDQAEKYLMEE